MPDSTRHRKHCRRYNEPGDAHFLTFSCYRRQSFLSSERACRWLADAVASALVKHQYHLWAYVFMPEHVHLLVWPTQSVYRIGPLLASIKLPVTAHAVSFVRKTQPSFLDAMLDRQPSGRQAYRFWQRGGGYDRNLWSVHKIWETVNYIHENPMRRGLCAKAEDWLWSSAGTYLDRRAGPLSINFQSIPPRLELVRPRGILTFDS